MIVCCQFRAHITQTLASAVIQCESPAKRLVSLNHLACITRVVIFSVLGDYKVKLEGEQVCCIEYNAEKDKS